MPKAANPNKLTGYFDRDWGTKKSSIRDATKRSHYSPVHSWDAMSDNAEQFSRLQSQDIPFQPSHPCTLSGKRVIELERESGMSALTGAEITKMSNPLPLSSLQRDVGLEGKDLSGKVPILLEAESKGKNVLLDKNYYFQNHQVRPPVLKVADVPKFYKEAGPNGDQILLNPAQRKIMMVIDAEKREASKLIQAAQCERNKLKMSLVGPTHHRGVLMYDTSDNVSSEVYGNHAMKEVEKHEKIQKHANERYEHLQHKIGHLTTNFNNLVPANAPQYDVIQKKALVHGAVLPFDQTKERIFQNGTAKPINSGRTQELRNRDIAGKNYDIITHTKVEHWPSNIDPKYDKVMMHPSQTSLNGTRNTWGTLGRN